ncbi:group II intron reverse transcriptase/maturase [Solitalea lacus]|uniref:group II intron reverse transcriptase/maturase n=1 Tax=Solitalea lacus TaxID=2911172 RepID=UPI001EDADF79|nr:group II intron reverse transcriptase/maturase [Solitalea lacus]UKJ05967.1 group II intron reverse transcriptase/maturase [Solitalea lacus]
MLERIFDRRNLERALVAVERNQGAAGIDHLQSDELRPYVNAHYQALLKSILQGTYEPQPVRKVEIRKPQGGKRMLGIPCVVDRMLQQAVSQWLIPQYEQEFNENSFGFRPGKNAHKAVMTAQKYLNTGREWIIELDLEKFFDKVNHQQLLGLLSKKIADKRTLKLVSLYLKSGIMEGGVLSPRSEGTPQGSPLSPLLSNIILNELDKELVKRGHKFVRYADDCSIYVQSKKAAQRVAAGIIEYIEKELLLKVNRVKTKISRPSNSYLLGFSFYKTKKGWQIRIGEQPFQRVKAKCKRITQSSNPSPEANKLKKLDEIIRGWVNYFKIANARSKMEKLDEWLRTRLRINTWRRWKRIRTKVSNLIKLEVGKSLAYQWGNTSKGAARVAHSPILLRTLNISYWKKKGYWGFQHYYCQWQADGQPSLF